MTDTVTLTLANANDASPVERSVPRRLGPVVLECEIGRGAMGVVFRGRHEILGRSVAVKLLLHALRGEEDPHFDYFRGEARMAAAVRHPNLTMIHHADVVDGIPYLVMDYIDGPQLSTLLKQFGPLPIEAALAAALAMTDAVAALHGSGIVHRDIKTRNTLLDRDGNVFVTDFGLALARARPGASMTPSGVAGTPTYMAPEMFDGLVSPRSDVYALGITTFELMTGSPPFTGSLLEVQKQHVGSPLPVAALEVLGVTPAIIDVLERATHKNATFRYKSADYYRQALEAVSNEAQRAGGRAVLKDLAARFVAVETPPAVDPPTSRTPTTTYFDLLGQIADQKRKRAVQQASLEPVRPSQTGELPSSGGDVQQADVTNGFKVGTLRVDLPCVKCRYNLRGLDVATRCSECGEPISNSAAPPRLIFSDPKWLARVQRGLTMIVAAPGIIIVALTISNTLRGLQTADLLPLGRSPVMVNFSAMPLAHILTMIGMFLATASDPSHPEERRVAQWRRFARIGACLSITVLGLHLPAEIRDMYVMKVWRLDPLVSAGALAATGGFFLCMEHLAWRNHDPKRARHARIAVVVPSCRVLIVVLVFWVPGLPPVGMPSLEMPGMNIGFFVASGMLLLSFGGWAWTWLVARSFRRLVKQERRFALALCAPMGRSTVALPSSGTLRVDLPCVKCSYNLRGLDVATGCPECGVQISNSAAPLRLVFADPKWLARVQRGLIMIVAAPGLFIVALTLAALQDYDLLHLGLSPAILGLNSRALSLVLTMIGMFLATASDRSHPEERRVTVWRRVARIGVCFSITVLITLLGFQLPAAISGIGEKNVRFALIGMAGALAATGGFFLYMEHLAWRNHDPKRARHARIAVAVPACQTLLVVLLNWVLGIPVDPNKWGPAGVKIGFFVVSARVLLPFGVWAWTWLVALSFWRLIRQERRLALALCAPVRQSTVAVPSTAAKAQEPAAARDPATASPDGPDDPVAVSTRLIRGDVDGDG